MKSVILCIKCAKFPTPSTPPSHEPLLDLATLTTGSELQCDVLCRCVRRLSMWIGRRTLRQGDSLPTGRDQEAPTDGRLSVRTRSGRLGAALPRLHTLCTSDHNVRGTAGSVQRTRPERPQSTNHYGTSLLHIRTLRGCHTPTTSLNVDYVMRILRLSVFIVPE